MAAGGTGADEATLTAVAELIDSADELLVITGAGLSADSGLPTYRGIGGLYEDATTEEGLPIEVALSGGMLLERPDVCWRHIHRIEEACRGARPNAGHDVLAAMEHTLERVWVLTQNVDGLHRAAGSRNVIEIHGNIHELFCTGCGDAWTVSDYAELEIPPACRACGELVRPRVVLFEEMLPEAQIAELERQLERGFAAVFTVGTSGLFPYIAQPVVTAKARGVPTVEINPGESTVSELVDHRLRGGAAAVLAEIWRRSGRGNDAAG